MFDPLDGFDAPQNNLRSETTQRIIPHFKLVAASPGLIAHFYMVGGIKPGFDSWEEATDLQPTTRIADESNGSPMLYSSGTTGQPKGVFVPPASTGVLPIRIHAGAFGIGLLPDLQ